MFIRDLNTVYTAVSEDIALENLLFMKEKWFVRYRNWELVLYQLTIRLRDTPKNWHITDTGHRSLCRCITSAFISGSSACICV